MSGRIIKAKYVDFLAGKAVLSPSFYNVEEKDIKNDPQKKETIGVFDLSSVQDSLGNVDMKNLRKKMLGELEQEITERREKVESLENQIKTLEERYDKIFQERSQEAEVFVQKAKEDSEEKLRLAQQHVEEKKKEAEKKAEEIIAQAQEKARVVEQEMSTKKMEYEQNIRSEIESQTVEKILKQSEEEIKRLVALLEHVTHQTINKRNEIIESAHRHLVDISLAVAKKVVKKIAEHDKELVLRNIKEALGNVKNVVRLTIRVNPSDWEISDKYQSQLKEMLESIEEINFLQDPTIEVGGCVVETDLGVIDAKISSQLSEIEMAVKEMDSIRKE